ncbi:MAG TPA: malonyl-CoA decarboxylase family protein [Alphaproteobacteria bacterium]|nr:malonyl-CoA decarboxylase family protein [Alphaproteobacteria bacterium]USO05632.1 MAG: malonyl-CoA decarboxylase family protein [Rhodospirillales bacterium]HOO82647.1 malonyl-CoA decarboxylase family protein [Alphaproteobacteria bacterium]
MMNLRDGFEVVAVRGSALDSVIRQYNQLYTQARKGFLSSERLICDFDCARAVLDCSLSLVNVTSDDQDILKQLAGNDQVHATNASTAEEILHFRAGGAGKTKQTFALVKPGAEDGEDRQVLTAIYGDFVKVETAADSSIPGSSLRGNVHEILTAPVQDIEAPNLVTFYSVTNLGGVKGVAGMLINRGLAHLSDNVPSLKAAVTLSPAWAFSRWAEGQDDVPDLRDLSEQQQMQMVYRYVCDAGVKDNARNLHLFDNGASVRWIQVRNIPELMGGKDDVYGDGEIVVKVNYGYDFNSEVRQKQKQKNNNGDVVVSGELASVLDLAA